MCCIIPISSYNKDIIPFTAYLAGHRTEGFHTKRETKGSKTKRLLYESALALFKEKGYDNVSVEEIAHKAGTAKGTFYIYFDSKARVITAILEKYDRYYEQLFTHMDPNLGADAKIDLMIRQCCRFTQDVVGLELIRVLYTNQLVLTQGGKEALDVNRSLYRILVDLVREGQLSGEYSGAYDPMDAARILIRGIRGSFYEWCLQEGGFDLTESTCRFTGFLRRVLRH